MATAALPGVTGDIEPLDRFLGRHHAVVVDVLPGAAPVTRRLLVGPADTPVVTHAVAVPTNGSEEPLATEERVLRTVSALPGELSRSLPRTLGRVRVGPHQAGLVLSAVPGLGRAAATGRPGLRPGQLLVAVSDWLGLVWRSSTNGDAPTLGSVALAAFLDRYGEATRLRTSPLLLQAARDRVAQVPVRGTLVHGCLCPRHTRFDAERVVGVDDWSLGSPAGNPLRDLGGFAARLAGPRLPEVIAGRTSYAGMYRQFLAGGLGRLGLPRSLWRDVLVLAQFEIAYAALGRGEADQMALLMAVLGGRR
ncbi:MAG TPA: hypothetical protein VFL69_08820 [Marmoricola sp.]|nr:hypothetical protein [Marmoricola sp.]